VNWGSYPGETLELVMAVLLHQERPNSWRRAASQGDGGVDVVDPVEGGYHVFQIKKFSERLTPDQKRQIKGSFEEVCTAPRLDRPVVAWSLVLPLDRTDTEEQWFNALTASALFPCDWRGRVFWDSEASKYPGVIDYYLRDEKARLLGRVRTLSQLLADPETPPRPADAAASILELRSEVNDADPHYRYDIAVTGEPPDSPNPRSILSQTRGFDGVGFVTIDVFARYPQALLDRPISGSFSVVVVDEERGVNILDAYRDHVDYGRALEVPEGALGGFKINAPGGLSGDHKGGRARLGPRTVPAGAPDRVEISLMSPQDLKIAQVTVRVTDVTVGNRGIELSGREAAGAFEYELRIDKPDGAGPQAPATWGVSRQTFAGKAAASVLQAARFLHGLRAPNRILVTLYRGPAVWARAEEVLDETEEPADDLSLQFVELLAELQPYTSVPLILPESVSAELMEDCHRVLRLLRGEVLGFERIEVELTTSSEQLAVVQQIVASGDPMRSVAPLFLTIAGVDAPFGSLSDEISGLEITRSESAEDRVRVTLSAARCKESLYVPDR
jgi:hypothetical protein